MSFSLSDAVGAHYQNWFLFSGKAGRKEYLLTSLVGIVGGISLMVLAAAVDSTYGTPVLTVVVSLFLLLANFGVWLPVSVRRTRDATGSGWAYLAAWLFVMFWSILFLPLGVLFQLCFMAFLLLMPSRTVVEVD